MFKRLALFTFSFVLLFSVAQSTLAQSDQQSFDSVKAKKALVEKHKDEFDPSLTGEKKQKHDQDVQLLLNKLSSGEGDPATIEKELKKLKVYKLEMPQDPVALSQPSDVYLNAVDIYSDASTGNWHVTGGGYWSNRNWFSDAPSFFLPSVGDTKNVGGFDSVGVTYYNTSTTYNATVVSSMGYWHDGVGNNWSSTSPSHGDGKLGVAFDYQDKVRVTYADPWTTEVEYEGTGFSATITYSASFADYNGKARTFYAHTWKSTNISSITFKGDTGGTFGADIQFSTSENKFQAFNNSDTNF
jgi:hypothetical protein